MRFFGFLVLVVYCAPSIQAEPLRFTLTDGTVLEIDDIGQTPTGGKITGRLIKRSAASGEKTVPPAASAAPIVANAAYETTITKYLRANVNDADKLEIVGFTQPVSLDTALIWTGGADSDFKPLDNDLWAPVRVKGVGVPCKFRATNGLGAKILTESVFLLNEAGAVFKVVSASDFRTERPKMKSNPFVDQFLAGADGSALTTGKLNTGPLRAPSVPKIDPNAKPDPDEQMRKWVSNDGKRSFEGQFVEYRDSYVFTKSKQGKIVPTWIDHFSDEDRRFIEQKALKE